jgi:hypothetical protein
VQPGLQQVGAAAAQFSPQALQAAARALQTVQQQQQQQQHQPASRPSGQPAQYGGYAPAQQYGQGFPQRR